MTQSNHRQSDYPIHPVFLDRWSPRSFTGESMDKASLMTILEAAHWAPSASNYQPWRFVYALKGDAHWDGLLGLLAESNQVWARSASALVMIFSDTLNRKDDGSEPQPFRSHSFDAGAAWAMLALQAFHSGYFAHAMGGVNFERALEVLVVPPGYRAEAAVAIGKLGDPALLPEQLQGREVPNGRKPLSAVAFEGSFPKA
ncbi:nitroreductase family protein [Rhizobium sp. CG5]|uniref:nitroreductase family protein n=1 Tax=Rhizobium sp. CG5 TaxID=2726076 RepID=UPI002033C507|nr:nitroreductase family protein [Rhizobium sp. CG5]MCM2476687.1 nitroreductase family protein [Rhizobium sp. CG5]